MNKKKDLPLPCVSVIIPVFNKKPYVERCLRSVLTQDLEAFEVIAVDDGSSDGSGSILDAMAEEFPNLRVIHVPNGGVTMARRIGFEASKAEYITFVDADDQMKPNGLKALYEAILRENADEVVASFDTAAGRHVSGGFLGQADPDEMLWQLCASKAKFCILWAVIFRKEILEGCLRDARTRIRPGQDILMQMLCLVKRPKVVFIPDSVYIYSEGISRYGPPNLEAYKAFDEMLRDAFMPRWNQLGDFFTMHQLKAYEIFILWGKFDALSKYYKDTRLHINRSHPLADRIIILLPPRLAYLLVKLRTLISRFS